MVPSFLWERKESAGLPEFRKVQKAHFLFLFVASSLPLVAACYGCCPLLVYKRTRQGEENFFELHSKYVPLNSLK